MHDIDIDWSSVLLTGALTVAGVFMGFCLGFTFLVLIVRALERRRQDRIDAEAERRMAAMPDEELARLITAARLQ